jgi:hypothetical protein
MISLATGVGAVAQGVAENWVGTVFSDQNCWFGATIDLPFDAAGNL